MELITKAFTDNPVALLSTHDGDNICTRPLVLLRDPMLGFYMVTHKGSNKLAQLAKNNDVTLLVGKNDLTSPGYVEAQAKCFVSEDPLIKKQAYRDLLKNFGYPSWDSDTLVILLFAFDNITYVDMKTFKTENVKPTTPRVLITGASGHNGKKVAELLLATKLVHVRVGLRDVAKGADLAAKGAEVVKLDWDVKDTIGPAFASVDRLFLLAPMALTWVNIFETAINAAKAAGIKYVVEFSGLGANPDSNMWLGKEHGLCENLVKNSGIPYTILQPTFFADNFVNFSGQTIQQASSIFNASGEGKVPWVATEDISLVAATLLMDPVPHAGKTLVLTGSEAITTAECAAIISKVIGKEVKYVDLPEEALKAELLKHMPEKLVQGLLDLETVKRNGWAANTTNSIKEVTGKEPMKFADYIALHKAAFA